MFSDLEVDYVNPIDLCNKLNQVLYQSLWLHWLISSLSFLKWLHIYSLQSCFSSLDNGLHFSWTYLWLRIMSTSTTLSSYYLHANPSRVLNQRHMYDATEIFRTLGTHKTECFIKLAFYLVSFFFYLYKWGPSTIMTMLTLSLGWSSLWYQQKVDSRSHHIECCFNSLGAVHTHHCKNETGSQDIRKAWI